MARKKAPEQTLFAELCRTRGVVQLTAKPSFNFSGAREQIFKWQAFSLKHALINFLAIKESLHEPHYGQLLYFNNPW